MTFSTNYHVLIYLIDIFVDKKTFYFYNKNAYFSHILWFLSQIDMHCYRKISPNYIKNTQVMIV